MAKENRLRKLERKKFDLIRNIKLCSDYKKEVIINFSKLKESFNQGFISHEEYYKRLSKSKYNEWIKYYDDSIKYNKNKLIEFNKEISKEERKLQLSPIISTIIILALIGLSVMIIRPEITGFTIGVEENITEISAEEETIPEEFIVEEISEEATKGEAIQGYAEINKPVRWSKLISLDESSNNLTVKIPKNASNIKFNKIIDEGKEEISQEKIKLKKIKDLGILEEEFKDIEDEFVIEDSIKEIEVEYYTEAPKSIEREINKYSKEITIYSDIHYENITAYTQIIEAPRDLINLYRTTNGIKEEVEITDYIDENNNHLIDKISWIVPSLSNETYEVVIEISKALHLNENKELISDIYNEVYNLDNIWSETINDSEYVRVTFEIPLDSSKDITIYPRIVSGNPRIEVYEVDGEEIIAEFTDLIDNEYNKIFLTNLQETQDTFDLKIVGGSVEFDHIIDPFASFVGAGTPVSGLAAANNITPTCPSYVADDILIVSGYFTDAGTATMGIEGEGWLSIAQLTAGTDDAGWWWKRATGSGTAGPRITSSDDDLFAICYVIRGAITTETPFEAGFKTANNLTTSIDTATPATVAIDTSGTNRVVVHFYIGDDDTAWSVAPPPSGWTLGNNQHLNSGTDVTFTVISQNVSTASTVPEIVIGTIGTVELSAGLTIAFIPEPEVNANPTDPVPIVNSTITEQTNYTNETLACNFLCSDPDTEAQMYYNISFLKNNVSTIEFFGTELCTDESYVSVNLESDNTTKTDLWNCQVELCDDESLCSNWVNSSQLTIENYVPIVNVFSNVTSTEDIGTITVITNADLNANFSDIDAADSAPTTYEIIIQENTTVKCYFDPNVLKCDSVANQSVDNNIKFSLNDSSGAGAITDFNVSLTPVNDNPWKAGDLDNVTKIEDAGFLDNLIPISDFKANWSDVEDLNPVYNETVKSTNTSTTCYFDTGGNWDCNTLANASGTDLYTISLNDSSGVPVIYDWQITITADNDAPWITGEVKINSTDGTNTTEKDLWCFFTPTDVEADTETADVSWLKDNITQFTFTNLAVTKDKEESFVLESENLTVNDLWNCQVRIYDQTAYSDWINSSQLTILSANSAPNEPTGVLLNSTLAAQTNLTNENLAANFLCDDPDTLDTLTYDISFYKEGVANLSISSISCSDPQYITYIFDETNTSKGENWSFSVNITDIGGLSSSTVFSNNITIENSNPELIYVSLNNTIAPFDGGIRQFEFSFVANDNDTTSDLDDTKAIANVSLSTENYLNNSCYAEGDVTGGRNYSCTIEMQYYWPSGSWNYATEIKDDSGIAIQNSTGVLGETQTWYYSELAALNLSVSALTWAQLIPSQTNQTATSNPITIENTGNKATLNIFAKAIDLIGASGKYIPAANFTIGNVTSASQAECDYTNQTTTVTPGVKPLVFVNNTNIYPVIDTLARGQGSNNNLYYCLFDVPAYLQSESYATSTGTEWDI